MYFGSATVNSGNRTVVLKITFIKAFIEHC